MIKDPFKRYTFYQILILIVLLIVTLAIILFSALKIIKPKLDQAYFTLNSTLAKQSTLNTSNYINQLGCQLMLISKSQSMHNFYEAASGLDQNTPLQKNEAFDMTMLELDIIKNNTASLTAVSLYILDRNEVVYDTGAVYSINGIDPVIETNMTSDNYQLIYPSYYDLNNNISVVSIRAPVYIDSKLVGYCVFMIETSSFNAAMATFSIPEEEVLLFDDSGKILYTNSKALIQMQDLQSTILPFSEKLPTLITAHKPINFTLVSENQQTLYFYEYLDELDVNALISYDQVPYLNKLRVTLYQMGTLIGLTMITVFSGYRLYIHHCEKQFHRFSDFINAIGRGEFKPIDEKNGNPYIAKMYDSYNNLLLHLMNVSDEMAHIGEDIHEYATNLNENATLHNNAITHLSKSIITLTDDTMTLNANIENLMMLSKAINIKSAKMHEALNQLIARFDVITSLMINLPDECNSKVRQKHCETITLELSNLSSDIEIISAGLSYLHNWQHDTDHLLKAIKEVSTENTNIGKKSKKSIQEQRIAIKNMSRVISNLYKASLNLNNSLKHLNVHDKNRK